MSIYTRFAHLPTTMRRDESGALLVEAVVSAGADVLRGDWIERLPADPAVWQLPESVPLLDNHKTGSVRDVIGTANNFRFEGGQMLATLRITVDAVAEQVERGSLGKISMGYRHLARRRSLEGGRRIETVTSAALSEVSLVIHPADQAAQLRSRSLPTPSPRPNAAFDAFLAELAAPTADMIRSELADKIAEMPEHQRAAAEARLAEVSDDDLMTRFGPKPAPARTHQAAPVIRAAVAFSNEDPAVITRRMVEAVAADAAGVPVEDAGANQYRGLSFARVAELTLEGTPGVRFMSESAIFDAAFKRSSGMIGTSDFSIIALGAGNRIVAHAHHEAASPLESKLVVAGTAPDFRPVTEIQRGGVPNLQPLTENGEIQSVSTVEAGTSWQIGTYAGRLDVTRKLLINDDKGLFGTLAADMGRAARRTETQAIVDLLVSNSGNGPTMADGKALFHADHGNKAGSGAAPSAETIKAAYLAVQAQRGLGGEIIGLTPAYLVTGPSLQFAVAELLAAVSPIAVDGVNILAGLLEPIADPRLTGNAWYIFAKPAQAPTLKVAHLAGQSGPVVQQQERWSGLGTSYRVFTDFGVTAVDHRGAYRNAGA